MLLSPHMPARIEDSNDDADGLGFKADSPLKEPIGLSFCFSSKQESLLRNSGYEMYDLTGQTITSLHEAGNPFQLDWHTYDPFKSISLVSSRVGQVAFHPGKLFLEGSDNMNMPDQLSLFTRYKLAIEIEMPGVTAIVGNVADYAELLALHRDRTHRYLFGEEYEFGFARTLTVIEGEGPVIVGFRHGQGFSMIPSRGNQSAAGLYIAPLLVPKA